MPAKVSSRSKNKKLTDFFAHMGPAGSPSVGVSAGSATTLRSTTRKTVATRAPEMAVDRPSSRNLSVLGVSASATTTRKRTRSPEHVNPSTSALPYPRLKSARKSLDCEGPAVVYVTPPFPGNTVAQRTTPAQVHGDSLLASPQDSAIQIVCSSQSDEAELAIPIMESRDLEQVIEGVHAWRQRTRSKSSPSPVNEDVMEVDLPPSSPVLGSPLADTWSTSPPFDTAIRSPALSRSNTTPQTPIIASACLPSPPDTNYLPALPPTPKPIDPEAKTAMIIAEIKARAFAANGSSDNESPLIFRELEDSDDDDLVDELPLIDNAKQRGTLSPPRRIQNDVFSSPLSSVPSALGDTPIDFRNHSGADYSSLPLRTSMRTRKPAFTFCHPLTAAASSVSVSAQKRKSQPPNHKKAETINPLQALLHEKQLQDKRGTSSAAVRLAEEAVRQGSRKAPIDSDDSDALNPVNQSRLTDERAAWQAVHESRRSAGSPVDGGNVENFTVGDRESKILGADTGEAINKILAGDKQNKGKENVHITGMTTSMNDSLWVQCSDEDMEVDPSPTPYLSGHTILATLNGLLMRGDNLLLDLALRAGVLAAVPRDVLMLNMPQLLSMALLASPQVSDALSVAFRDLWGSRSQKIQLLFTTVLVTLVKLGANTSTLEELGFVAGCVQMDHISWETRLRALKRLLAIMKAAGSAGAFAQEDIADLVLSLVVVGLDPLTSVELSTEPNFIIDIVCNICEADYLLRDIHEKVLSLGKKLAPVNRARLVSLFASGSGRTKWIARGIAYCLLVSVPVGPKLHQAPPLAPLILLLSPDVGSCELFDVTNDSTDFEELRHYIVILSVALDDITPYVNEEYVTIKPVGNSVQGSPSRCMKPPTQPLEHLRRALEVLQSKIVDTRAAHLDRSRTKAAIQRLTMRIIYDRMALMGSRLRPRASTLKSYFSPRRQ